MSQETNFESIYFETVWLGMLRLCGSPPINQEETVEEYQMFFLSVAREEAPTSPEQIIKIRRKVDGIWIDVRRRSAKTQGRGASGSRRGRTTVAIVADWVCSLMAQEPALRTHSD